jgi:hypothetical protein
VFDGGVEFLSRQFAVRQGIVDRGDDRVDLGGVQTDGRHAGVVRDGCERGSPGR